jgi:hypothetical protein
MPHLLRKILTIHKTPSILGAEMIAGANHVWLKMFLDWTEQGLGVEY